MGRCLTAKKVTTTSGSVTGAASSFSWSKADTVRTSVAGVIVLGLLAWAYLLSSNTETGGRASFSLLIGLLFLLYFSRQYRIT